MSIIRLKLCYRAGDTLIEVLFAITVFSVIAVGALTIMNRGTAMAQTSLETTLVRQQIDNQAESLRYLNSAYVTAVGNKADTSVGAPSQWMSIPTNTEAPVFKSDVCVAPTTGNPFFIDTSSATVRKIPSTVNAEPYSYQDPVTYAQILGTDEEAHPQGLWITAAHPSGANYTDFYINACWWVANSDVPSTIGTVVRLYVPSN